MENTLQVLSVYSVLIPLLMGLLFWKFQDANARIMIVLLAFATCSQLSEKIFPGQKNAFYNLYTIVDIFFWSVLLYINTRSKLTQAVFLILSISLITLALVVFISSGLNTRFYSYLVCFDSMIQVICVLVYFYEKYKTEEITRLADDSMFWFCIGILFYAPCTYFIFVFRSVNGILPVEIWIYHHVLNIFLYLIITIGLMMNYKRMKFLYRWTGTF
jgi:hypothetical protein